MELIPDHSRARAAVERMAELTSQRQLCENVARFEHALIGALEDVGLLAAGSFDAMADVVDRARNWFDQLDDETARVGRVVQPVVRVLRAESSEPLRTHIHYGATTQDALDTAWALSTRDILHGVSAVMQTIMSRLAGLADCERDELVIARTNRRHAGVTSVGYRAACWLDSFLWEHERLADLQRDALCVQYAGPVGTLLGVGKMGLPVREALARRLKLALPRTSWHAARHRPASVAQWAERLVMVMEQCADEIWLRSSEDLAELVVAVPAGHGISSSLAHKRNPRGLEAVIAAVRRVRDVSHRLSGDRAPGFERSGDVAVMEIEAWAELWQQLSRALVAFASLLQATHGGGRWTLAALATTFPSVLSEAFVVARATEVGAERAYTEHQSGSLVWRESLGDPNTVTTLSGNVEVTRQYVLAGAHAQIDQVLAAWRGPPAENLGGGE